MTALVEAAVVAEEYLCVGFDLPHFDLEVDNAAGSSG